MPVRALTFDFWNTMVVARANGSRRQAQRQAHLEGVVRAYQPACTSEEVATALNVAVQQFQHVWKEKRCTLSTSDLVHNVWSLLDVQIDETRHAETVNVFEEGLLYGPPAFVEGLPDALAWAAQRYRLGLISDTMFSPGRVIRRLLQEHDLLRYFDAFVFSDEVGYAKPDVRAFEQAAAALDARPGQLAHIGDLRRTDVAGARKAGAQAVLFTGVHTDAEPGPEPDAVLDHWDRLSFLL
jgi:putative hydrolase of the HAD superfamily